MAAPSLPESSKSFGPYTLISKLGQGGMGEVHLAHDSRLERKVAIKLLPEELFREPERRTRFLREARAVAQLSHPNITQIFDVGEANGRDYIAFELVEGRTLGDIIAERPMSLAEVIDLALPLADAIAYAHERGIVHRDLKPNNVMVTQRGHAKLLDFGLAKILNEGSQAHVRKTTTLTLQGAIFGTPASMSPEQALGKSLDARSDVFSFGSLLYEMASGRAAFVGATMMEVMDAVIHRAPDPLARMRPDLPLAFVSIVDKALRKDPGERYQTMSDLAADLRHFKRTTDSDLVPPVRARRSRRWIALAVAVLVCGEIALLVSRMSSKSTSGVAAPDAAPAAANSAPSNTVPRQSLALLPFSSLGSAADDANFAAGLHSDVLTRLSKISSLKVISRNSVLEYATTPKSLKQIGQELGVSAILTGEVQRSGNAVRLNLTLHDARTDDSLWAETYDRKLSSESLFEIQSNIAEEVARALQASLSPAEHALAKAAPTKNDRAYDLYMTALIQMGSSDEEDQKRALQGLESAVALDPRFALAWAELAGVRMERYWLYEASDKGLLEAAFAAARRSLELDPDLPEGHLYLGKCHYVSRDYEKAMREYEIAERGLPGSGALLMSKGSLHRRIGQWEKGLSEIGRAIELSPRDSELLLNQAESNAYLGRWDDAERWIARAEGISPDEDLAVRHTRFRVNREGRVSDPASLRDDLAKKKLGPQSRQELFRIRLFAHELAGARADLEGQPEWLRSQHAVQPRALLLAIADELDGRTDAALENYAIARKQIEIELDKNPNEVRLLMAKGLALAGLGHHEAALVTAREATQLLPIERDAIVGSALMLDRFYTELRVGALDEAVTSLDAYISHPGAWSLRALSLDPRLDVLRDHSGFRALTQRTPSR